MMALLQKNREGCLLDRILDRIRKRITILIILIIGVTLVEAVFAVFHFALYGPTPPVTHLARTLNTLAALVLLLFMLWVPLVLGFLGEKIHNKVRAVTVAAFLWILGTALTWIAMWLQVIKPVLLYAWNLL